MSFNEWKYSLVHGGRTVNRIKRVLHGKDGDAAGNAMCSDEFRCKKFKWTVSLTETVPGRCTSLEQLISFGMKVCKYDPFDLEL